jgi:hypothetical protein
MHCSARPTFLLSEKKSEIRQKCFNNMFLRDTGGHCLIVGETLAVVASKQTRAGTDVINLKISSTNFFGEKWRFCSNYG